MAASLLAPASGTVDALRPVLETALDAVIVMGADGRIVGWNSHAEALFGWTEQEARGSLLADMIIPEHYREQHAMGLRRFLETGEGRILNHRIEIAGLHRSGREVPVELAITPVGEGPGLVFLGFLRDITERRRAEDLLRRRARDAELLFQTTSVAAVTDSFEDAVSSCLDVVCEMTGWPVGHAFVCDEDGELRSTGIWRHRGEDRYQALRTATEHVRFASGVGLPGRILEIGRPVWLTDAEADPTFVRSAIAKQLGVRAAFGFPVKSSGRLIAIMEFFSDTHVEPDPDLILTVQTLGEQVGRVFERRRAEDLLKREKAALEAEVARRTRVEQHQQLLLAELKHRVRNTIAVVSGVAAQTARSSRTLEEFTAAFSGRLQSLARAHDLLTAARWEAAPLRDVIEQGLAPHGGADDRIELAGPDVTLSPHTALSVAMVVHELATNAVKHGALSVPGGRLSIRWTVDPRPVPPEVALAWTETGLADLTPPSRKGFGSKLIETSAGRELGGRSAIEWRPEGLHCAMTFPLRPPEEGEAPERALEIG